MLMGLSVLHAVILMLVVQVIVLVIVFIWLKSVMDEALFSAAVEQFYAFSSNNKAAVHEIRITSAGVLTNKREEILKGLAEARFPGQRVIINQDFSLCGGLLIQVGDDVLDHSLAARWKAMFQGAGA